MLYPQQNGDFFGKFPLCRTSDRPDVKGTELAIVRAAIYFTQTRTGCISNPVEYNLAIAVAFYISLPTSAFHYIFNLENVTHHQSAITYKVLLKSLNICNEIGVCSKSQTFLKPIAIS